jgi:hypothetical protein
LKPDTSLPSWRDLFRRRTEIRVIFELSLKFGCSSVSYREVARASAAMTGGAMGSNRGSTHDADEL